MVSGSSADPPSIALEISAVVLGHAQDGQKVHSWLISETFTREALAERKIFGTKRPPKRMERPFYADGLTGFASRVTPAGMVPRTPSHFIGRQDIPKRL